ncbi:MAG TPA: M20/M25/M40 family metallo-hydrolase, partial [Candidatus Obscuribacter sp.]|nr:M20/M25/M40 family metallo-hydrolase [Candidatus Obscuribacter sp.]
DWRYPPFGGEIHDGEIWGRGTLDMKGMGMMELEAMLAFKRLGLTLDRDLVFLATPDEEVGGSQGAQWFTEHKKELLKDCEFLLNEGSSIEAYDNGKGKYWGVDVGEKSVLWLALKTRGLAGHASMPQENSANNRLLRALARLADNPPPFTLLPEVQNFYEKIAHTEESPLRELYAAISKAAAPGNVEAARLLKKDLLKSSMLANTVSITVLKAGYKTNVIPAESYCELDCRLLPGVKAETFIEQLKGILQDDSIEISTIQFEKADPSPFGSAMVEAIRKANQVENEGQKAAESGVPVVPVVVPWFTDSHWFRDLGIKAYGFEPVEVDAAHLATMHGKDERVAVKSYRLGIERLMRILYFVSQD